MESLPPPSLLDYDGAAVYLGDTPRHVERLWAERRIAAVKVGKKVRFRREDLDAYIEANRIPAVR